MRESVMLTSQTGSLGRGVRASFQLAALLLATNFVASTAAQSSGSRKQPNTEAEDFQIGQKRTAGRIGPIEILPAEPSPAPAELCASTTRCAAWFSPGQSLQFEAPQSERSMERDDNGASDASTPPPKIVRPSNPPGFNQQIYYRNNLEFSLETGWHPINIPFIYDFAVGGGYNMTPLKYTLVPVIASLRWHVTNVGWRWFFRGNMDFTFSGSITAIPRGPETHYFSLDFGIRRNFVYRNWKVVPFFEQRGGAGLINAKEPLGIQFAQGQNLTFTYNMGAGAQYNIDSKYSFSARMNYMHISNAYLSQPQFYNYGINVYGPMFGLDVRLGKPHHSTPQ